MSNEQTFPDGLPGMLDRYENRRSPFEFGARTLPEPDVDLIALIQATVPEETAVVPGHSGVTTWDVKRAQIAAEFIGKSELAFLNAQLISNLRKRSFPRHAPALFRRIWSEQADHLLSELDLRWLVSSVQTFADHGDTPIQRETGQALRMLFGMMKLYEFERLFSGRPPETAFLFRGRSHAGLPLEMQSLSLEDGGLPIALLAPVWTRALQDSTIAPLVDHLMTALNDDPGTIFRRFNHMRNRRAARRSRA